MTNFGTHCDIKCVRTVTASPKAQRIQETVDAINDAAVEFDVSLYNPTAFIIHIEFALSRNNQGVTQIFIQ